MRLTLLLPTISLLYCPGAYSDDLPPTIFGTWFEATGVENECSKEASELDIARNRRAIQVSGRSGDWVCTWSDGRVTARIHSITESSSGEMIILSFKSQCERIDDRKYPAGTTVVTYVQRQRSEGEPDEEIYIGS
jgi:hypothetical protein